MVFNQISSLTSIKKSAASKLALGSASIMMMTVIGASGVAGAAPLTTPTATNATASASQGGQKDDHGGKHHTQHKNHGNHGYGGDDSNEGSGSNNDVRTNVKVDQRNSSHNFASVVINYLFR